MKSIFLSYRREDSSGYTGWLFDRLSIHFDSSIIFRDLESIQPGEKFDEAIQHAVSECGVFLAIIGKRWLKIKDPSGRRRLDNKTDFVRREIETALQLDIPIIPVLVGGAKMPHVDHLPKSLMSFSRFNAFLLSDKGFKYEVDRLVEIVRPQLAVEWRHDTNIPLSIRIATDKITGPLRRLLRPEPLRVEEREVSIEELPEEVRKRLLENKK